ncbi:FecR family protein [Puteibacter caeruleilacunae]|nr:FecR family protein [Puteibacter caeruleilacunae]
MNWEKIASHCNEEPLSGTEDINQQDLSSAQKLTSFMRKEKQVIGGMLEYDQNESWSVFSRRVRKNQRVYFIKGWLKYAAIFIGVFLLGYGASQLKYDLVTGKANYTTFEVPNGEQGKVFLADGTEVLLNSGSSLKYKEGYSENRRVVLDGEGLFKVTADKDNPFVVKLDGISIKVTGTVFNIRAYGKKITEATLLEGTISVLDSKEHELVKLKPNQQVKYFHKEKRYEIGNVDGQLYSSWGDGKVAIKNKRLDELFLCLEKWYDVKFSFEDDELKSLEWTGTVLTDKPIEQLFEVLQAYEHMEFEIKTNNDKKQVIVRKTN